MCLCPYKQRLSIKPPYGCIAIRYLEHEVSWCILIFVDIWYTVCSWPQLSLPDVFYLPNLIYVDKIWENIQKKKKTLCTKARPAFPHEKQEGAFIRIKTVHVSVNSGIVHESSFSRYPYLNLHFATFCYQHWPC